MYTYYRDGIKRRRYGLSSSNCVSRQTYVLYLLHVTTYAFSKKINAFQKNELCAFIFIPIGLASKFIIRTKVSIVSKVPRAHLYLRRHKYTWVLYNKTSS